MPAGRNSDGAFLMIEPSVFQAEVKGSHLIHKGPARLRAQPKPIDGTASLAYVPTDGACLLVEFKGSRADKSRALLDERELEILGTTIPVTFAAGVKHKVGNTSCTLEFGKRVPTKVVEAYLVDAWFPAESPVETPRHRISFRPLVDLKTRVLDYLKGGHQITCACRVERRDESAIEPADSSKVIAAICAGLSLLRCRRVDCAALYDLDSSDLPKWMQLKGKLHLTRGAGRISALISELDPSTLLGACISLRSDPYRASILDNIVRLYVSTTSLEGEPELALVNACTSLELLSWIMVVETVGMLSAEGFEKLWNSDRLRLLFSVLGQNASFEGSSNALVHAAKDAKWEDVPRAITDLRNAVIHPTRKNREKLGARDGAVVSEVSRTATILVERCIVSLLRKADRIGAAEATRATKHPETARRKKPKTPK